MYSQNLIETIKNMDNNDYEFFESTAFEYHFNHLKNHRLRKADFKIQLQNFISGETTKISFQNFDSYLYALDQLTENGSQKALQHGIKITKPLTWRQLFLRITTDIPLPKNLKSDHLDDVNTKILKSIFQQLLSIIASSDKNETGRKLRGFDEFLKVFRSNNNQM
ncbi:hypothetical protein [Peribacillus frigoritolerans]|uniref:hypothetical protein n=1 Tax=Peribacillus frigoritolerans TaxID=450367 RepID=UPI002E1F035F|nr:hypothetical protein [Peribacillus frigoritolerans]MED3849518.1 hypothetical protein [Peribacillus frigoritolerans]